MSLHVASSGSLLRTPTQWGKVMKENRQSLKVGERRLSPALPRLRRKRIVRFLLERCADYIKSQSQDGQCNRRSSDTQLLALHYKLLDYWWCVGSGMYGHCLHGRRLTERQFGHRSHPRPSVKRPRVVWFIIHFMHARQSFSLTASSNLTISIEETSIWNPLLVGT